MTYRHVRNVRSFFSDYYLGSVFHRGEGRGRRRKLSDRDTDLANRRLQRIREQAEDRCEDAPKCRERFLRPLFRDVLGFHIGAGEERIHGLHGSAEDEAAGLRPLALLWCGGWDEDLSSGRGSSSPQHQLEAALDSAGALYGFLATGERLRLVRAPGEGPRRSYLEIDLAGLVEDEDPESFALFFHLAHANQFLAKGESEAPIRLIEAESKKQAEKVSEDLKRAVFSATEMLVGALLADAEARGATVTNAELPAFRDAGLTAIYRLLFILYAEDRDPRLQEHRIYFESYSLDRLIGDLLHDPAHVWASNRSTLWSRLTALFRVYHAGLAPISPWQHIPPRGGNFFDASTAAGKLLDEARLGDREVAALLQALATTAPRRGVGRERVSFRELDIESLGSVYEGLLEFEPRIASETTLEVKAAGRTYALVPSELVRLCEEKQLSLTGELALVEGTTAEALHPERASDDEDEEDGEEEVTEESDGEDEDGDGLKKGSSARLLRCFETGTFHFVPGGARKGSGSFYTPRLLVQDIVRHALGPLVAGKSPGEIERLRVLDPACGSAHFLVEAMRFLGQALHRAYVEESGTAAPSEFRDTIGQGWDDDWEASDEAARAANSEARAWCKRRIAERCLFGVDLNATAVELARVALWIESLAGDRPLSYFRHHIRHGNSLLGTWLDRLDVPPLTSMGSKGPKKSDETFFGQLVRRCVQEAARLRRMIDEITPDALRAEGAEPESVDEFRFKELQHRRAEDLLAAARLLFDLRSASAFLPTIWGDMPTLRGYVEDLPKLQGYACTRAWWPAFTLVQQRENFFHWQLEFPEVLLGERPGFDAVLGNPPWDKVLPSKHEFYARADVLIRAFKGNELDRRIAELHRARPGLEDEFEAYSEATKIRAQSLRQGGDFPLSEARSSAAHEDVAKYFVDRAARVVAEGGRVGLVVPSVLYNGDGCVGIRRFLLEEARIERFYGFENRRKHFPIDSRYKFVSLVFQKGAGSSSFDMAFMRNDMDELLLEGRMPWTVRVTREEIERFSPETLAFLEYRGPRDQDIVQRMQTGRPTLGGSGPGSWGVTLFTDLAHELIYNSARDKDLFTDPETGSLHSPESVLGHVPDDLDELLAAMRAKSFWPVFEGKHIDQFLVGIKPIRWWLSVEQAKAKYGKPPREAPTLVFRETASNTNERTCIAAVLPQFSGGAHTLTGVLVEKVTPDAVAAVLNSVVFDFALRLRTAGIHVSFTYILPVAVPSAQAANRLPPVAPQLAWRANLEHISDDRSTWPTLWSQNRAVAEAYDLTPTDLAHVLSSFPGFARKRPDLFAYFQTRLAEWKEEHTVEAARPGEELLAAETPGP